jgi:hypothetical protein
MSVEAFQPSLKIWRATVIEPLRIIKTKPQLTALIPITVPREDIRKVMGPGLAELKAAIAAQNVAVTGPWFTHHVRNPAKSSISKYACRSPLQSHRSIA